MATTTIAPKPAAELGITPSDRVWYSPSPVTSGGKVQYAAAIVSAVCEGGIITTDGVYLSWHQITMPF